MRKLVAGIAAFTCAAVAGVWFLTRDGAAPGPAGSPAEPAPTAAPQPLPTLPPPDPARPFAKAETPPTLTVVGPSPVEPPRDSWEAVPIVARASALGPAGGPVGRGLNELQPRVAACFDEDTQARYGTASRTAVKDAETLDAQGASVLLLQIQIAGGQATIEDAPLETQGAGSDGLVACAQRVLRGQRFSVPEGKPGRYRLLFPLSP